MDDTIAATVCMTTTGRNKAYTASNVSVTCIHMYVLQRKYIVMCNDVTIQIAIVYGTCKHYTY